MNSKDRTNEILDTIDPSWGEDGSGPQPNNVYEALKQADCKMDNHESDLYVEDTQTARDIIARFDLSFRPFKSNADGKNWLEVPFMYQPFWDAKFQK